MRQSRNISRVRRLSSVINIDDAGPPLSQRNRLLIALAGNPNSGKTTLFNALTGGRQRTGNYAGVTIEKKEGIYRTSGGRQVNLVDLPGLYSLSADSPEEIIAQEVLSGTRPDVARPDAAVVVVDATNMERNLYLATQIMETGVPVIVVLNMLDIANKRGLQIDTREMSKRMGTPVVALSAKTGEGLDAFRELLDSMKGVKPGRRSWTMDGESEHSISMVAEALHDAGVVSAGGADWLARRLLFGDGPRLLDLPEETRTALAEAKEKLTRTQDDMLDDEVINRYQWIRRLYADSVRKPASGELSRSELVDRVLLHKVAGPVIFAAIMLIMFQAIFTWSAAPMEMIEGGVAALGETVEAAMPEGLLKDLVLDGVIAGVGNVVVFLPQIVFLFFFIALLEDTGYMTRAAFLLDRVMGKVGLNGHAFIPLLSSFACAVPGIMSTRTIRSDKDRLVTILVAPLMTCSARLPVYLLLIAAFFPQNAVLGFFSLQGLIMLGLYLGGIVSALGVAWLLKRFLIKGERSPLILEMPSYKIPQVRNVGMTVWNASWAFIKKAGTVILVMTIVLWFLISHPQNAELEQELLASGAAESEVQMELVRNSYIGMLGQTIEPAIQPLGYDWKIGVSIISSFAAREVIVGTLAIIYASGSEEETALLSEAMKQDRYPGSDRPVWTPLVAASVLVFFVFALMCMSTLAVIKKETQTWRWPVFAFVYLFALAWVGAFLVYQGGLLLGLS